MRKTIARCGLDCEKCEAFIATARNDDALRTKVAREWSELNRVEITPDMINCEGCRADGAKTPFCESLCPIKKCSEERGYGSCGECPGFEECEKLGMIIKNSPDALARLIGEEENDRAE